MLEDYGAKFFLCNGRARPMNSIFVPTLYYFPGEVCAIMDPTGFSVPIVNGVLFPLNTLPVPGSVGKVGSCRTTVTREVRRGRPVVVCPRTRI